MIVTNTKRPDWDRCDENDTMLLMYQEELILNPLSLKAEPKEWRDYNESLFDSVMRNTVELIMLRGRYIGSQKTAK